MDSRNKKDDDIADDFVLVDMDDAEEDDDNSAIIIEAAIPPPGKTLTITSGVTIEYTETKEAMKKLKDENNHLKSMIGTLTKQLDWTNSQMLQLAKQQAKTIMQPAGTGSSAFFKQKRNNQHHNNPTHTRRRGNGHGS